MTFNSEKHCNTCKCVKMETVHEQSEEEIKERAFRDAMESARRANEKVRELRAINKKKLESQDLSGCESLGEMIENEFPLIEAPFNGSGSEENFITSLPTGDNLIDARLDMIEKFLLGLTYKINHIQSELKILKNQK